MRAVWVGKLFLEKPATFEKFEADGRTDWKSKKKVYTPSDILFSTENQLRGKKALIQRGRSSASSRGPHKMVPRAACGPRAVFCPDLGYTYTNNNGD